VKRKVDERADERQHGRLRGVERRPLHYLVPGEEAVLRVFDLEGVTLDKRLDGCHTRLVVPGVRHVLGEDIRRRRPDYRQHEEKEVADEESQLLRALVFNRSFQFIKSLSYRKSSRPSEQVATPYLMLQLVNKCFNSVFKD
jgi:hypothetical protein